MGRWSTIPVCPRFKCILLLLFCFVSCFGFLLLFFVFTRAILNGLTVPQFVFAVCACSLCFAFVYGLFYVVVAVVVVVAAAVAAAVAVVVVVVVFVVFVCCFRFSLKKGFTYMKRFF